MIVKRVLFFFLITLVGLGIPFQTLATPYGSGSYGEGVYNVGEVQSTPTPDTNSTTSNNSSNPGLSDNSPPANGDSTCSAPKPSSSPDLFQINSKTTSTTLFFSPSSGNRDRYYVMYGLSSGAEQYGFEFLNDTNGVVSVEVNALQPNTPYYFKVRAANGCMPGDWSNELAVRTGQRFPSYRWSALPKIVTTGVTRRVNPGSVANVKADASKVSPSPTSGPTEAPASQQPPVATPQSTPPQTQPQQDSPGFFGKISRFLKSLF